MDDLEFVQRCVSRDKKAWDEFVDRYSHLIYNYIYSIFENKGYRSSPETVNDLYQEIFVSLIKEDFKKLRQFKAKNGASLASWLRIITINFSIDFLRQQRPIVSLDDDSKDEALTLKETLKDNCSPKQDEVLLNKEKLDNLLDCIAKLNNEDKYFLEMHIYRDIDLEDLKTTLKVSRSTIDMRKSRIIKRLRDCFKDKGFVLEI